MGDWAWLIWTAAYAGAALAAIAGGLLIVYAVAGRRGAEVFGEDESPHGACDCCGYELAGLEHGYCPECGWRYVDNARVPPWRRWRAALAGTLVLMLAAVTGLGQHVMKHGVMSLMPSAVLIAALPLTPVEEQFEGPTTMLHRTLQTRMDLGKMRCWERRWLACQCAGLLGGERPEPVRVAAARLLTTAASAVRDPDDARGIITGLDDPSPATRTESVRSVVRLNTGDPGLPASVRSMAVQRLMGAAMCDPEEGVRRAAIDALAMLRTDAPGAAGVYARAARDPSPLVRARTLYALYARPPGAEMGERELAAATLGRSDQHSQVREAAVYALSRLAERADGAVMLLGLSLRDTSPEVRQSAASCLAKLGPRAAAAWPSLLAGLHDENPEVARAAAEALAAASQG